MNRTARIEIREEPARVEEMQRAAELDGESFSSWARRVLRREARRVLAEAGEHVPVRRRKR